MKILMSCDFYHESLERRLRFDDASAAPVIAADTGRDLGSELRT